MTARSRRVNRRLQNMGMLIGVVLAVAALALFFSPGQENLSSPGPLNAGHEDLQCESCHLPARGNLYRQIQANARYLVGLRETSVDFGHYDVENSVCRDCHDNPEDRHPVHRFNEPRFQTARDQIQPQLCDSCHREHQDARVTIGITFCQHCHQETQLSDDPIAPSHATLIGENNWESCLQCHDFHGNHVREVPLQMSNAISLEAIDAYFAGGASPYGESKRFPTRQE